MTRQRPDDGRPDRLQAIPEAIGAGWRWVFGESREESQLRTDIWVFGGIPIVGLAFFVAGIAAALDDANPERWFSLIPIVGSFLVFIPIVWRYRSNKRRRVHEEARRQR